MTGVVARRLAGVAVAISTILVIAGAATVLFLNPAWVGFEQGRADTTAWTGWTAGQVGQVTGAILSDLVFGPGDFAMTLDGSPVFDAREQGHMRDVRRVFTAFGALVLAGVVVVLAAWRRSRSAGWFWTAVGAGAAVLAGSVVFLGVVFGLAFDTAFDVFHRLFFAGGSYAFDPATERLVQLFPETFWYETTIALGVVVFIAGIAVAWYAIRRATAAPAAATVPTPGAAGGSGTSTG